MRDGTLKMSERGEGPSAGREWGWCTKVTRVLLLKSGMVRSRRKLVQSPLFPFPSRCSRWSSNCPEAASLSLRRLMKAPHAPYSAGQYRGWWGSEHTSYNISNFTTTTARFPLQAPSRKRRRSRAPSHLPPSVSSKILLILPGTNSGNPFLSISSSSSSSVSPPTGLNLLNALSNSLHRFISSARASSRERERERRKQRTKDPHTLLPNLVLQILLPSQFDENPLGRNLGLKGVVVGEGEGEVGCYLWW